MWRRQWHPTPVLLPGKSHGQRSLVGCSPWGRWWSDTTEQLHFHFPLLCIEGNGNPLQCSCLESLRDGGAWWAAVCGIAQSQTPLKRLSSSSSCGECNNTECDMGKVKKTQLPLLPVTLSSHNQLCSLAENMKIYNQSFMLISANPPDAWL